MIFQAPLTVDATVRKFCGRVSPGQTPVLLHLPAAGTFPDYEVGECFENVRKHCERFGGSALVGWCVHVWPRVTIEFEQHCIHQSGDSFLDVSPRQDRESMALFLPSSVPQSLGSRLDNIRFSLSPGSKLVDAFIKASTTRFAAREAAILLKRPTQELAEANQAFEAISQQLTSTWKIERNDPCPCGSRRKYKACHAIAVNA